MSAETSCDESDATYRSVDTDVEEDIESLDWESNHGELSFVDGDPTATSSPLHVLDLGGQRPATPLTHAAWPPRHPSSETDPNFLEDRALPQLHDRLGDVSEEDEEVFDSNTAEDTVNNPVNNPIMPARQTAADILAKLQAEYGAWEVEVSQIKESGEVTDMQLDALKDDFGSMRAKFKAAVSA